MSNNKFTTFNLSEELKQQLAFKDDFSSMLTRMERAESKNLEQELRLEYLEGRQGNVKDAIIDLFLDGTRSNNVQTTYSKEVKEMFDTNENFTWKPREDSELWTNGIIRNDDQHYMLEVIDEYNLEGVGQAYKCAMKYDSVNNCYWMMSHAGNNAIGEITKLSTNMKDGKVEVLGRWYIPAGGEGAFWKGLAVSSDGTTMWFCRYHVTLNNIGNTVYGIAINIDGTLGAIEYTKKSGETIDLTNSIYASGNISATGNDTGKYSSICQLDNSDIGILVYSGSTISIIARAISNLGRTPTKDITGLGNYVGGSADYYRSFDIKDNVMYVRMDDVTDDKRFIYKFDLTTDVVSNIVIKSSGRFENARNVDSDTAAEGSICFSHDGHLLEVVSTASNGKFIAKRALKNALWAENQVSGEKKMTGIVPSAPLAMMVTSDGAYWTSEWNVAINAVKLVRYDTDGTKHALTLTGSGIYGVRDLTTDGTTVWIITYNNSYYQIYYVNYATLKAAMDALADGASANFALNTNGTLITAFSTNGDVLNGICYDVDVGILYVLNQTDAKIDTLATTLSAGAVWTQGVYDLPAPTSQWYGIAYKNSNIYVGDYTAGATPCRVFVIPKNKANATYMWRSHIYQDPTQAFAANARMCFDFDGNDLVSTHLAGLYFTKMKVLEDPDVMQLHTFMDAFNILISSTAKASLTLTSCGNVSCCTPIVERYFAPEDFADIRDCPDKNYMAVGYGDEGFSLLHLDKFLSGRSSTGKPRYDVRDIRTQHYKRYTGTTYSSANIFWADSVSCSTLFIEKDMIFVGQPGPSSGCPVLMVDLKLGKAMYYYLVSGGNWYLGTLTERNDGKGYNSLTTNAELATSSNAIRKIHARTFTKEDASDYNGENPKTFVAIGTDGGCDLLVIDWDENGNRTPVKVWNNVYNDITVGRYGNWVAPSGKLYGGSYDANGKIYKVTTQTGYVWEIQGDAIGYSEIGSNILGGYVMDISPNSYCWKTPSGTWRHQLICGTGTSGTSGNLRIATIDVENATADISLTKTGNTFDIRQVDNFEEYIYGIGNRNGSPAFCDILFYKKLRFNDKDQIGSLTNWSAIGSITSLSRPLYCGITISTVATSCRHSVKNRILSVSSPLTGLQMFMFPRMDGCKHTSVEMAAASQDVSEVYYKEYTVEG